MNKPRPRSPVSSAPTIHRRSFLGMSDYTHELVKEMNMARMEIPMFFMSMNIGLVDFPQPRQAFSGDKLEDITTHHWARW